MVRTLFYIVISYIMLYGFMRRRGDYLKCFPSVRIDGMKEGGVAVDKLFENSCQTKMFLGVC